MGDNRYRPAVMKWLPWWETALKTKGKRYVLDSLHHKNGHSTKYLTRKDRFGLIQALNLVGEK